LEEISAKETAAVRSAVSFAEDCALIQVSL
jgi:hypothetical protein